MERSTYSSAYLNPTQPSSKFSVMLNNESLKPTAHMDRTLRSWAPLSSFRVCIPKGVTCDVSDDDQ